MCPTHKSARFESSCITSHISLALQPNGKLRDLASVCICVKLRTK
ncbi:hypothetical protein HanPSC8_Chr12g0523011 [Helianthus annuus]|nr:hypothetical protein HanPSC8_Chr12g0523011 [Helianthus annuus]